MNEEHREDQVEVTETVVAEKSGSNRLKWTAFVLTMVAISGVATAGALDENVRTSVTPLRMGETLAAICTVCCATSATTCGDTISESNAGGAAVTVTRASAVRVVVVN